VALKFLPLSCTKYSQQGCEVKLLESDFKWSLEVNELQDGNPEEGDIRGRMGP
jgi:hypothetical protein